MRHHSLTVIDEFLPAGSNTTSSTDFNARMAAFDQIALHAVIDNVTGTATGRIDIFVDESGDARNWVQRNSMLVGLTTPLSQGDISVDLATGGFYQMVWSDAAATTTGNVRYTASTAPLDLKGTPFLPFVRLRFVLATVGAHVKVHATLRGPR